MPSRRRFLLTAPALIGLTAKAQRPPGGSFVNEAFPLGHRLRDRAGFRKASREQRIPVVIVGGGMAGLSAAWHLNRRGFKDFVLLEMEREAGGNSRWGENEISAYPWAAHYVPVPDLGATLVRELFTELGVLKDGQWDERHLCFAPQERLFLHGRWQDGLEPEIAATGVDRADAKRFAALLAELRTSGEFTIPLERGAAARKTASLDQITFAQWIERNRFTSPYLKWYLDYACRDDYGASAASTSAWAGLHYFLARDPDDKGPLTWPEGNGWIVRRLLERVGAFVRPASVVYRVERAGTKVRVRTEDVDYVADRVIFAAPTFLAPYLVEGAPPCPFVYSPWLTANLTLDRMPREKTIEPAWDNVIYDSPALGYVVATHMGLRSRVDRTVWTYYWALTQQAPAEARRQLLEKDWNYWREAILHDLERAHPDIRSCVSRIDIMRMGHAMARPTPGFLTSQERRKWSEGTPPVYYANSDLSGFSIFEEAQFRGVRAADRVLRDLGRSAR